MSGISTISATVTTAKSKALFSAPPMGGSRELSSRRQPEESASSLVIEPRMTSARTRCSRSPAYRNACVLSTEYPQAKSHKLGRLSRSTALGNLDDRQVPDEGLSTTDSIQFGNMT